MKALAVFPQEKKIRLIDHPLPTLSSPTDIKLRMLRVGVCGTDREIWNFEYGEPPPGSDYLITGHESLGQVAEVGSAVRDIAVGDLVVPTVRRGCPEKCLSCANQQPDFCFTGHFTERGIKKAHGYMTEFVVDDQMYMNKIPTSLREVAVLLEPLTISEKALLQIETIQSRLHWECRIGEGPDDKSCRNALVLGAGPVGLLAAMAFRSRHMRVAVVARSPQPNAKADIVEKIGARYYSSEQTPIADLARDMGNIDVLFEATGAAKVAYDVMPYLGANGIFVFTSVPAPHKDITIDAGTMMRNMVLKNQVIVGTVNAPKAAFQNGIADLQTFQKQWPSVLTSMITERISIDDIEAAVADRGKNEIKTLLTIASDQPH